MAAEERKLTSQSLSITVEFSVQYHLKTTSVIDLFVLQATRVVMLKVVYQVAPHRALRFFVFGKD